MMNFNRKNSSKEIENIINDSVEIRSDFNLTAADVKEAALRFEKEGSQATVGNTNGVAGIGLLKNRYHRARRIAVATVVESRG